MSGRRVDWVNHPHREEMREAYRTLAKFANFKVDDLSNDGTVLVKFETSCEWVPFHVLELIEPAYEKVKVTVEKNGTSKEMEFTEEEWAKIEKTVN